MRTYTAILTYSGSQIAFLRTWPYRKIEFILRSCITRFAFCFSNSLSTNTTNTRPAAPQLLLSLSQWGVGQTSVDSGVAPVSLMIHTQCFANLRVSTHTSAHASPASQPASVLLCNNKAPKTFFSCANSWVHNDFFTGCTHIYCAIYRLHKDHMIQHLVFT